MASAPESPDEEDPFQSALVPELAVGSPPALGAAVWKTWRWYTQPQHEKLGAIDWCHPLRMQAGWCLTCRTLDLTDSTPRSCSYTHPGPLERPCHLVPRASAVGRPHDSGQWLGGDVEGLSPHRRGQGGPGMEPSLRDLQRSTVGKTPWPGSQQWPRCFHFS